MIVDYDFLFLLPGVGTALIFYLKEDEMGGAWALEGPLLSSFPHLNVSSKKEETRDEERVREERRRRPSRASRPGLLLLTSSLLLSFFVLIFT